MTNTNPVVQFVPPSLDTDTDVDASNVKGQVDRLREIRAEKSKLEKADKDLSEKVKAYMNGACLDKILTASTSVTFVPRNGEKVNKDLAREILTEAQYNAIFVPSVSQTLAVKAAK